MWQSLVYRKERLRGAGVVDCRERLSAVSVLAFALQVLFLVLQANISQATAAKQRDARKPHGRPSGSG